MSDEAPRVNAGGTVCGEGGEMGDLGEGFPAACPACGASRKEFYYFTGDCAGG